MTEMNLDNPIAVDGYSTKPVGTFCGLTQVGADRIYGYVALAGHGLMALSGKFSGNPWELATGLSWASSSAAMAIWPGRKWTLGYVGITVIFGSITLAIGSAHKDHNIGHLVFSTLAVVRSAFLLCNEKRFPNSPTWQYISRNKKELNGSIAFPSRMGLLIDGVLNGQPLIAAAAVLYQICDLSLIASGRAQKRTHAIMAKQARVHESRQK